jgi:hypothetical protein
MSACAIWRCEDRATLLFPQYMVCLPEKTENPAPEGSGFFSA